LISKQTGLGELLSELLPDHSRRLVLPVLNDEGQDAHTWGDAIAALLKNRQVTFTVAQEIRDAMATKWTWAMAATQLLESLGSPATARHHLEARA